MSKTLEFIFDFASPNAYLAYHALGPVLERTGASLKITPCLLGGIFKATGNQPPFVSYGDVKEKMAYEQLEMQRFIAKNDLTKFSFNPNFPVNTLLLVRGAIAADMNGQLEQYVQAGLKHMWEEGLKMDDPEVYAKAMTDAGFDGEALLASTQDSAVKAQLMENTSGAVARGCFGIPTFYVGDEMFFGKDRLTQIEEALSQ